ncbi:aminoglycoside phosphotransferase family protein [Pseudonocardia xinjiangensis]|uniref:Aminoglycoside phosphotransferase family protein n=1 Tax=Pseudonocardia xinjiangensis TaxID=75289 RepID=A0ABX1RBM3_9PSEU|nr:aminoglycoside phosphotransferase family protein [Pseudonocardia xinjiangensis]
MRVESVTRLPEAFQRSVSAEQITAMAQRAFGPHAPVVSAVELGNGMYNNTYRVEPAGQAPVILRVAPEPGRQNRIERELMRNEHASLPYFAPIAHMMPRTLAVDFTHDLIGRDYLFQTMLPGVPAADGLAAYPRSRWTSYFRQMGSIARRVHSVRGPRFGPVAGPGFSTWSAAVIACLEDTAADLDDAGLDATDVRAVAEAAARDRAVLDEIVEPRLLHGDLWTVNVMLDPGATEPTISGVFDHDRASWGDPEADWTVHMAGQRPGAERDTFWESYGTLSATPEGALRRLFYRARHIGAIRLECHRLGRFDDVPRTYDGMRLVLDGLHA